MEAPEDAVHQDLEHSASTVADREMGMVSAEPVEEEPAVDDAADEQCSRVEAVADDGEEAAPVVRGGDDAV